jgi:hypothetical protein
MTTSADRCIMATSPMIDSVVVRHEAVVDPPEHGADRVVTPILP